ncbi:MAG TPA: LEA type 2 family protein [Burkholderiales bacterium]|nr:LEA type 2 family protein [Burkholderiales bacterium]
MIRPSFPDTLIRVAVARFAVLALICAVLFGGCQSVQDIIGGAPKPKAQVIGASIRGLSLENIVLLFDVEVENPYAANLPLADLHYSLASGSTHFADGSMQPTGSIPARGKQVLQLPVTVQFASLLAALKGVKAGAVVPYTAEVKIGVDAPVLGRVDVPLSKSGEIPVPAAPQVKLSSLAIGKLGFDQITASAKMQVKNTNQFALDLTKFGFLFALGGLDVGSSKVSNPVKLPAGQTAIVEVPLSFSPRAAGVGIVNLLKSDQIAYQISGSIDANSRFGPLTLPFSHIGNTKVTR